MSSPACPRPASLACAAVLLFACAAFTPDLAASAPAPPRGAPVWVPASGGAPDRGTREGILYEGMAGRLVAAEPARLPELEQRGAVSLEVGDGETLWLFLVEDAERAEFEPPARVVLRAGHEVLVVTDGSVPRLTAASDAALRGLKQPVRLGQEPLAARPRTAAPAITPEAADPLVAQMVAALTPSSYLAVWQALDDFETRYTFAAQNESATQWILDAFHSYGLRAEFHDYLQSGPRRNVVATLPGVLDSTKVVYICAHMDATSPTPTLCAPGADDNASGTAAVLEAARILSQYRFAHTIKFVAFNGEEQGLVGSANYAADVAALGEDVVGVFNLDMIAYPGSDPAPPDMVIYTDEPSQGLAATLAGAADTYVPGELEPLVYVQALGGSDHFSFWRQGYNAVLAIEAEAWSADFCPWYHTCSDRIEQYALGYPVACARANLAAVALTAGPFAPAGRYLALGPVVVDDDGEGLSSGNGDGAVGPGETIELWLSLRNEGPLAATGVGGVLRSASAEAAVLDSTAGWDDLPAGASGTSLAAFRIAFSAPLADGQEIPLALHLTDDAGPSVVEFSLRAAEPVLAYWRYRLDDVSAGNGNGVPDPGEVLDVRVQLANRGARDAVGVSATATSGSAHLSLVFDTGTAAAVPAGGQSELGPALRVAVSPDAVDGEDLPVALAVTEGGGAATQTGFVLRVGSFFLDQMESDTGWSLRDQADEAHTGRWVRADPIGTASGANPVQPEDDHTPGAGTRCFVTENGWPGMTASDADVDGGAATLTSPVFDLTGVAQPRATYWRWYTNNLGSNPSSDVWVAQVSADGGGSWVDLERTTASANSWQQRSFPLASYIVPSSQVVFRFIASDAGGGSLVEAALDDFEIEGEVTPVDVPGAVTAGGLRLEPPRPNPAGGEAALAFHLPVAGRAILQVFGVDGRLVRTLVDGELPAGPHRVAWDGTGDGGRTAPAGVYFCRLWAAGQQACRRLARLP